MFLIKIWKNKRNSLTSSEKLRKINNNFYDIIPTGFFTLYNLWLEILAKTIVKNTIIAL